MRKRSEIAKTKHAASTPDRTDEDKPKAAASPKPSGKLKCPTCEEIIDVADVTTRDDGTEECPSCAAPLPDSLEPYEGDAPAPKEKPSEPKTTRPADAQKGKIYCGECGAEWIYANGTRFKSCGHTKAEGVASPKLAKKWDPPAGHARLPVDMTTTEHHEPPTVTMKGRELFVVWNKSMFRVADYSTFTVGSFSLSTTLAEGDNPVAVAEGMLADLKAIAEKAFEAQREWYFDSLGLLKK